VGARRNVKKIEKIIRVVAAPGSFKKAFQAQEKRGVVIF
jgi:hypothetical protein